MCTSALLCFVCTGDQLAFDQKAYERALTRGKRRVARLQLTFIGAVGVGKTNLCNNLVQPGFDENSDSTSGIQFTYTSTSLSHNEELASDLSGVGPLLTKVPKGCFASSAIADAMHQEATDRSHGSCLDSEHGISQRLGEANEQNVEKTGHLTN